ncbi:hypothetical protein VX037_00450 [Gordonia sp. Z-3]|jgi:hypothetical protein|uniref:Uncharacterized protein n=2 Tax=Gordonia TaxID=2053 RepID=A0A9X3D416_9ACTN|nr:MULTISPECIES: hypothetical protein [Gordonia]MCF3940807.1 hypothetical protein [Gordonia tangerina]MCX2964382.1 hypothetical protein [Gordonia aquimaris]MED5799500.1 hypothetical protein [Gordonia sp. Z-3]
MLDLIEDIRRRAEITPRLTAVRFGDDVVTYGALDEAIDSYRSVMDRHGMSHDAAFHAGLIHCMPGLTRIDGAAERNRVMSDIVAWLGRELGGGEGRRLRAVS